MNAMSPPAENARPAPVTTTAPTSSSWAARLKRVGQRRAHLDAQRVERVGTVERDERDAAAPLVEDFGRSRGRAQLRSTHTLFVCV
jgi:hypothetical protein